MSKNTNLSIMAEVALSASLAMCLSFLQIRFGWVDISLGQIVIILLGLRRGLKPALFGGLLWGGLHFLTGQVYYLSFLQVFMEYILAFTFSGLGGLYQPVIKKNITKYAILASIVATFARFFWHFLAGVVFWSSYAPKGINPVIYSLLVNGGSAVLTSLVASLVLVIVLNKFPKLLQV
jgi:putative proton-coupled thiamine transporter YuaJ